MAGGGSAKPLPCSQTLERLLPLFLEWQDEGLCNPQGTQSPTSVSPPPVFVLPLPLSGGLIGCIDFLYKRRA